VSTQAIDGVRDRIIPMLQYIAEEYRGRVPVGFPVIVDLPEQATVGLELDPGHSLYVVSDGEKLFADLYYRSSRWDARSSASREKFGGAAFDDRRPLPSDPSDQTLRNLVAELISRFNNQQTILYITDT
jgi:hypothetical protein